MNKKLLVGVVFALCLVALFTAPGKAQQREPELWLSWRAQTYTPPGFVGKALPTTNTIIIASADLVDGGKIANLSKQTTYWYLNDNLLQGGIGIQRVSLRAIDALPGTTLDLRIELPNYHGGTITKTVTIPVVKPEVAIVSKVGGVFSGASVEVGSLSYFFNISKPTDLSYLWNVNGDAAKASEDPTRLVVNLPPETPSGFGLDIELVAKNPVAELIETGLASLKLTHVR